MARSSRSRLPIILLVTLAICAAFTVLHHRSERTAQAGPVSAGLRRFVLAPPSRTIIAVKSWSRRTFGSLFAGPRLEKQNLRLRSEVAALSQYNQDLQDEAAENVRLRKLLAFQARSPMHLLAAQVSAFEPSSLRDTMMLSRGVRNGVQTKMAVIDGDGALVGQVIDTTNDTCNVLLLTDDLSSVGATVQPKNRAPSAVVKPATGLCRGERSSELKLIDVPAESDIRPGDTLATSGLGAVYPKGIAIGTVESVALDSATYLKTAKVRMNADPQHLQEVFVVLSH